MSEKNESTKPETTPESAPAPDPSSSEVPAGETNTDSGTPDAASTHSNEAPETATPRGLRGSGLRYTDSDDVPSWAQGRTADEILDITNQLYAAVQRGEAAPPPTTPSPQPHVTTPQPTNSQGGIPSVDPNLIYSNPEEYHRQMEARTNALIESRLQAASTSITSPLASMAKTQARGHRPEIWDRYGPEIEATMASMPPEAKSNVETWKRVVNYVAGEHVDEIAAAKAQEIVSRGSDAGQLQTGGGGSPGAPGGTSRSPIDVLFNDAHPSVKGFLDDGISAAQVKAHAKARGYDEESYAKMLKERAERRAKVHSAR